MPTEHTPYAAADDRYDQLEYARVGRSGLKLPRISLGLWNNFGDDKPIETQRAILRLGTGRLFTAARQSQSCKSQRQQPDRVQPD